MQVFEVISDMEILSRRCYSLAKFSIKTNEFLDNIFNILSVEVNK